MDEQRTHNDDNHQAMDAEGERTPDAIDHEPAEQGASPQEDLVCGVCGHAISQDDLICPNCGVSLAAG